MNKCQDMNTDFCSIRSAARRSGLPEGLLRRLIREGQVPCIWSGTRCVLNYTLAIQAVTAMMQKGGTEQ